LTIGALSNINTKSSKLYVDFSVNTKEFTVDLTNILLNNSWHMLTVTNSGSSLKYYIDNVFYESLSNVNNFGSHSFTRLGAGYRPYSSALTYFSGSMDNIRFYNRAITNTEITALYNAKQ